MDEDEKVKIALWRFSTKRLVVSPMCLMPHVCIHW